MIELLKNSLLLSASILLLAFFAVVPSHAQEQQFSTQEQYLKSQYEFLKNEAIRLEDRVDSEREAFINKVQLELAILVAILGLFGLGGFLTIKDRADKALDEYIKKNGRELQQKAEKWAREVVRSEFGLNKHIVLLVDKKQHKKVLASEAKLLELRGFDNLSIRAPREKVDDADLVVFFYKDDLDKNLSLLVKNLEAEKSGKPLVVYYKGNVPNQKVRRYPYHVYANTPLTLAAWVFTVLTSYKNLGREVNHDN